MREQVCIVLNEREAPKARAAESLQQILAQSGISAARIPVTEHLEKTLKQRQPRVLIIDYLLGDYSTGLDILSAFSSLPSEKRPVTIFLTDEPSVQVAVDAMKGGARDYLPIEHSLSIGRAARLAQELLRSAPPAIDSASAAPLRLRDLVANAKHSRMLHEEVSAITQQQLPFVVLLGEPGSGRSTLARAMNLEKTPPGWCEEIDLRTAVAPVRTLLQPFTETERTYTLAIDHVSADHTDLLEGVAATFGTANRRRPHPRGSTLVLCTSEASVAQACERLGGARVLHLPQLCDRTDDIPALAQRFTREAEEFAKGKLKPLDAATLLWLQEQAWPQHLRQLRATLHDALLIAHSNGRPVRETLEEARLRWDAQHETRNAQPALTPLAAAQLYDRSGGNWRVAAALAGLPIPTLQALCGTQPNP